MPVLFGDVRPDGKIKVWRTQHICPVAASSEEFRDLTRDDARNFPEGWWFEAMPEFPQPEVGKEHEWLFDPKTSSHVFETKDRPLTTAELLEQRLAQIESRITAVETTTSIKR